jgi:hypothetical protein
MMPANVTIRHHRVPLTPRPSAAYLPLRVRFSIPPAARRSLAAFASLSLQPYQRASPAISTTPVPSTSAPPF